MMFVYSLFWKKLSRISVLLTCCRLRCSTMTRSHIVWQPQVWMSPLLSPQTHLLQVCAWAHHGSLSPKIVISSGRSELCSTLKQRSTDREIIVGTPSINKFFCLYQGSEFLLHLKLQQLESQSSLGHTKNVQGKTITDCFLHGHDTASVTGSRKKANSR